MPVIFTKRNDDLIVSVKGEIDHHETVLIRNDIDMEIQKTNPKRIVFDMKNTVFMDSSGLGLILGRYRRALSQNREFIIANPGEKIYKILSMAGVEKTINIIGVEK